MEKTKVDEDTPKHLNGHNCVMLIDMVHTLTFKFVVILRLSPEK